MTGERAASVMVQGCSSWAGKSLLATALARILAQRGLRVAPFKALNMSNNARAVDGGEIATAQYLQALAARVEPEVRMNPVLVAPETERRSQVVVLGRVDHRLSRTAWRGRAAALWPKIEASLRSLQAEADVVLIEGAGSPAEFNLWDVDVANMRVAELAGATVLLVADIDQGGAFAHLWGTWALLPPRQRSLIKGFVLNKFRGEASLLDPAPTQLQRMTGVPVIGLIPYLQHGLPDEEGAGPTTQRPPDGAPSVAVIRYPTASNLDEFKPLEHVTRLRWAWTPADLDGADLVILPGAKSVAADLRWLREHGFHDALQARTRQGGRLLAICGGLQMLGERLDDPANVDGNASGLSILPLTTRFESEKIARPTQARFRRLPEPWCSLSGLGFRGYEIRHGRSEPSADLEEAIVGGLGFVRGPVLATYVHGMFEAPKVIRGLFGADEAPSLDEIFDELADRVEAGLDASVLATLVSVSAGR